MTVADRPKQQKGQPIIYTPDECRDVLKLGRDKVYELLRSGELTSRRVGRRYLIPAEAVADFLKGAK